MALIFLLVTSILSGCMAPTVKRVSEFESSPPFFPDIQFTVSSKFKPDEISCIAVGNFEDKSSQNDYSHLKKSKLIRAAIYGVLSVKNYRDIELNRVSHILLNSKINALEALNCDALLSGQIITFKNSNFLAYSVTTVEVVLTLENLKGDVLWRAKHAAKSHEGSLPISTLSLLTGVVNATNNREDEIAFQMIDAVARRTMAALPDRKSQKDSHMFGVTLISKPIKTLIKTPSYSDTVSPSLLLTSGAYEDALKEAKLLIEKEPGGISGYTVAAKASFLLGKFNEATNYALEALALDGANKEALTTAGYSYLKSNKLLLAEGAFQKIISLENPKSEDFHNLGLVQLASKNIDSASGNFLVAGKLAISEKASILLYSNLSTLQSLALSNVSAKLAYEELGGLTWEFLHQR